MTAYEARKACILPQYFDKALKRIDEESAKGSTDIVLDWQDISLYAEIGSLLEQEGYTVEHIFEKNEWKKTNVSWLKPKEDRRAFKTYKASIQPQYEWVLALIKDKIQDGTTGCTLKKWNNLNFFTFQFSLLTEVGEMLAAEGYDVCHFFKDGAWKETYISWENAEKDRKGNILIKEREY